VNFVLDTNVVSELRKPRPNVGVLGWHAASSVESGCSGCPALKNKRFFALAAAL